MERLKVSICRLLWKNPNGAELNSALVQTLVHEGKIAEASTRAIKAAADDPRSAAVLTALAEVRLREGQHSSPRRLSIPLRHWTLATPRHT